MHAYHCKNGSPNGIRTRVLALRGLRPRPLVDGAIPELIAERQLKHACFVPLDQNKGNDTIGSQGAQDGGSKKLLPFESFSSENPGWSSFPENVREVHEIAAYRFLIKIQIQRAFV